MNIRAYADRIAIGNSLADKLFDPSVEALGAPRWNDSSPGPPLCVARPGRPPSLAFPTGRVKDTLPGRAALADARQRGLLLHRFANHELLALEIMAATLLRFPDAPAPFRRSVATTMTEEQIHLRLYLARMEELGVELGEIPVNDFFWRCMADVKDPLDYVARMPLVFEQANLDFTLYYRHMFAEVGDDVTAALLQRVYDDELGHVKVGLTFFRKWRAASASDWSAFVSQLAEPLSPARAKGTVFDRDGRKRAGFDDDFIEQLEIYARSRGRPPRVFYFNPACEDEIERNRAGFSPSGAVAALALDLAPLLTFVAAREDVVVTPVRPSADWCRQVVHAGFALPEFVGAPVDLAHRKLGALVPWGWSPDVAATLAPLRAALTTPSPGWAPAMRDASSKVVAWEWRRDFLTSEQEKSADDAYLTDGAGEIVTTTSAAAGALARGWILKAPFSTAGRGRVRGAATPANTAWIRRHLDSHGVLRAEPWRERVLDLSFHYDLTDAMRFVGICRFFTDARGQFAGTCPGRWSDGVDKAVVRFLREPGRGKLATVDVATTSPARAPTGSVGLPESPTNRLIALAHRLGAHLAPRLIALGVSGPVGVDAFVYRDASGLRLDPLVEVNPRWTMGRISLALGRRVHPTARATWRILALRQFDPGSVRPLRLRDGLLLDGTFLTTDSSVARQFVSVMEITIRSADDADVHGG